MFKQHNIITAVEIGTSKVCVLIGEYTDEDLNIIGKGETSSSGAVVKGEIVSMDLLIEKLIDAMDQADTGRVVRVRIKLKAVLVSIIT